jgi:hypothetical protein
MVVRQQPHLKSFFSFGIGHWENRCCPIVIVSLISINSLRHWGLSSFRTFAQ